MKYIKNYEDSTISPRHAGARKIKHYWLVPTDDRFLSALDKIGCNDEFIRGLNAMDNRFVGDYIFVHQFINRSNPLIKITEWSWNPYKGALESEWAKKNGYTFKGIVDIDPIELDVKKYNL